MEYVIFALLVLNAVLLVVLLLQNSPSKRKQEQQAMQAQLTDEIRRSAGNQQDVIGALGTLGQTLNGSISAMGTALTDSQTAFARTQTERLNAINDGVMERQTTMNQAVTQQLKDMSDRLNHLEASNERRLEAMRLSTQESIRNLQTENTKKLDEIRGVVDEKLQDVLQKRIAESFQTVSTQLEEVYKGLGEMKTLATDVGGLKQVLSGVKTRGILGEVQLRAILEEILSPEQYDENVATIPGSRERVEFAIRLPGTDGNCVYLPIDSKFPGDRYMHLQEAQATGDPALIESARKELTGVLKLCAKDISEKYVSVPYTTNFGILFLPFEGLYAEVVNLGLIEELQRTYHVNIAGPSTMAALLNSLQMGFHTLAIQKRSNEVWQVLGAVKTEFGKFEDALVKMQGHLNQTSADLETLMGTRTRAINRKLREVHQLDDASTQKLLEE